MDKLLPITYTHDISDIHVGGFSLEDEKKLGFSDGELFEAPKKLYELVTIHKKNFAQNLDKYKKAYLHHNPSYKEIASDVFVGEEVEIHDSTAFDTKNGLIVIERGVRILPFCFLVGPLRIDEDTIVSSHSNIKNSYLGKNTRIGGEVANSVIESYTNKAHHGYLGESYVGSWVNIGGGTSTSNLKNTYGTIKINGVDTGEQFLGSIICDFAKIATNTSIYTGKIIGVGSHVYGTVTTDVPSFVNYISKEKMIGLPLDVTIKTAERMAIRRSVTITEEIKKMLSYTYDQTQSFRSESEVRSGKLEF